MLVRDSWWRGQSLLFSALPGDSTNQADPHQRLSSPPEHLDNFSRVQYAVLVSMLFLTLDALRQGNIVQVISVSAFK